jgi:rhodanese-related sulfurtransferase
MKHNRWSILLVVTLILTGAPVCALEAAPFGDPKVTETEPDDEGSAVKIELITVEELKSKMAKNEPVTIIDVRSTDTFAESDNTIKGSIHFKLRRLKTRFRFPPLRDLPRDTELVTYCACPDDKASIRAAQILIDGGFKRVRALKGGWVAWVNARGPIQPRMK